MCNRRSKVCYVVNQSPALPLLPPPSPMQNCTCCDSGNGRRCYVVEDVFYKNNNNGTPQGTPCPCQCQSAPQASCTRPYGSKCCSSCPLRRWRRPEGCGSSNMGQMECGPCAQPKPPCPKSQCQCCRMMKKQLFSNRGNRYPRPLRLSKVLSDSLPTGSSCFNAVVSDKIRRRNPSSQEISAERIICLPLPPRCSRKCSRQRMGLPLPPAPNNGGVPPRVNVRALAVRQSVCGLISNSLNCPRRMRSVLRPKMAGVGRKLLRARLEAEDGCPCCLNSKGSLVCPPPSRCQTPALPCQERNMNPCNMSPCNMPQENYNCYDCYDQTPVEPPCCPPEGNNPTLPCPCHYAPTPTALSRPPQTADCCFQYLKENICTAPAQLKSPPALPPKKKVTIDCPQIGLTCPGNSFTNTCNSDPDLQRLLLEVKRSLSDSALKIKISSESVEKPCLPPRKIPKKEFDPDNLPLLDFDFTPYIDGACAYCPPPPGGRRNCPYPTSHMLCRTPPFPRCCRNPNHPSKCSHVPSKWDYPTRVILNHFV